MLIVVCSLYTEGLNLVSPVVALNLMTLYFTSDSNQEKKENVSSCLFHPHTLIYQMQLKNALVW